MRIESIQLSEGSNISNLTVASGTSFPSNPNNAEMFYRTDSSAAVRGLYVYISGSWDRISSTDAVTTPTGASLSGTANTGDLFYLTSGATGLYVYTGSAWIQGAAVTPVYVAKAGDTMTGNLTIAVPSISGAMTLSGTATVGNAASIELAANGNAIGTTSVLIRQDTSSRLVIDNRANADMIFSTNDTARLFLTAAGALSFGTSNAAPGTSGQVLVSGGSGTTPAWASTFTGSASLNVLKAGDTVTGVLNSTALVGTNGQITVAAPSGSALISGSAVSGQSSSIELAGNGTTIGTDSFLLRQDSVSRAIIDNRANADMVFLTNGTARLFLTAAGALSFGTSNTAPGTSGQVLVSGGSGTTPAWASTFTGSASLNVLKAGDSMTGALSINVGGGVATSSQGLTVLNGAGNGLLFVSNASAGAWNTLTKLNDAAIISEFGGAADGAAGLVLGIWSASAKGLRIDSTGSVSIGTNTVNGALNVNGTTNSTDMIASNKFAAPNMLVGAAGVAGIPTYTSTTTFAPALQVQGTTVATSGALLARFANDTSQPGVYFGKSRNATVGSHTIVQSGDSLMQISSAGSDGFQFTEAVRVMAQVDAAPTAGTSGTNGVVPGRLIFMTSSATATPVERMRIDSNGNVGIAVTPSTSWGSTYRALELQGPGCSIHSNGGNRIGIAENYIAGATSLYASTAAAAIYELVTGTHTWFTAPSGTGGTTMTSTQVMTLDNSGYLSVGTTTSAARIAIVGGLTDVGSEAHIRVTSSAPATIPSTIGTSSSGGTLQIFGGASALSGSARGGQIDLNGGGATVAGAIQFRTGTATGGTSQSEVARIDSSGNMFINTTAQLNSGFTMKLNVNGSIVAGTTSTAGSIVLQGNYGTGALSNWGTEASSGGPVTSYGAYPSSSAASFLSSTGIALTRSALIVADTIRFYTGASQTVTIGSAVTMAEVMRIDGSGNIGVGVTPQGWGSKSAIESAGYALWGATAGNFLLGNNVYQNSGGTYIYKNTAAATLYYQNAGAHAWYVVPSGSSGGTITLGTAALTLDNTGVLLLGTVSNPGVSVAVLSHVGSNAAAVTIGDIATAANDTGLVLRTTGTAWIQAGASGGDIAFKTTGAERMRLTGAGNLTISNGNFAVSGSTNTLGYSTGSGGTVTQATSRTTGVTLNKSNGAITLFSAAGSSTATTFTVTNSTVAATDTIIVNCKSSSNAYLTFVTAVGAGSFNITFQTTGGTGTDAPVFNFAVIKAVAA